MTKTVQTSETRLRGFSIALAVAMMLAPAVAAEAQTFTVLYVFTGGADGGYPQAGLIRDAAGNLYSTTSQGGDLNTCYSEGCGTVFKLAANGKETVLYSFTGHPADGSYPIAGLVRDAAGNLYGTTFRGGASNYGTVFKVAADGNETVLYSFTGYPADGSYPSAGLVRDAKGDLYGTTAYGGSGNCDLGCGTVFKLDTAGEETVLYSFTGTGGDGVNPYAGLVRDPRGQLYGTTDLGGASGAGTVFKVANSGKETVLYSFTGGADGGGPVYGYLVRDAAGNLYGTTAAGGSYACKGEYGCGVVYKLNTAGKETVLHTFTGTDGDGYFPVAGLLRDAKGNLYGTTAYGGSGNCYTGCGTVFKLDKAGNETVLHSFDSSTDGAYPYAGLVRDARGNLYGTTEAGGAYNYGVVFELTP
jgi:uncharacterized repeat protein (TIGR03803 family)